MFMQTGDEGVLRVIEPHAHLPQAGRKASTIS
jgi:hypothetical protein